MKKLLGNLSTAQRITIAVVALAVAAAIYALVHWRQESDFKPLFTGLAAEDAAGIVQKLKEGGVEYRLPESGGAVLVPSARLAELRLSMASAGLPKTGRIGFELFDKSSLGATEFTEHVNYRRAIEGELERSVMSLAEVEQARVHITFPKDSIYLDAQQPAKASVMVKIRPGARLAPQNVQAINHLVASAVEGLSPDAVSVLDMNGNLLGRPKPTDTLDGPAPSEAALDYRHKLEGDLIAKINSTLEPLLGSEKFRAGVSVDCDFSGGEQSEELFDPSRSVMVTSQRTEDTSGTTGSGGVPGAASNLPRPAPRATGSGNRTSRVTENIAYQTSRTVRKTRLPAGGIRKMSVAVLVDQELSWTKAQNGYQRVLSPPSPEKLKIIHDLVAGVTGFSAERGDQIVIESLPFETTLTAEPPSPPSPVKPVSDPIAKPWTWNVQWNRTTIVAAAGAGAGLLLLIAGAARLFRRRGRVPPPNVSVATALPAADAGATLPAGPEVEKALESQLAEREALQQKLDSQALNALKLAPVITKAAEVMAKHLREKIHQNPEMSAQVLRTWIREEEDARP
jgi:flagellar M-ring protein FliF